MKLDFRLDRPFKSFLFYPIYVSLHLFLSFNINEKIVDLAYTIEWSALETESEKFLLHFVIIDFKSLPLKRGFSIVV